MLAKRIIPCLDVKDGRVVKGINFVGLKDAGDPIELAKKYDHQNADELVFLDIAATNENRGTVIELTSKLAKEIFIPFTIGGGISSIDQIEKLVFAGADKIAMNSSVIKNPSLISEGAERFGSQCIVVAIDARKEGDSWNVYTHGGKRKVELDAVEWAQEAVRKGAGEILLTSMDADGTKAGFDLALTKKISSLVNVPVIASGGGGTLEHFAEVLQTGIADAALAASIFHYGEYEVKDVKEFLKRKSIPVRF